MNSERNGCITDVFTKVINNAKRLNVEHGVSDDVKKKGRELFFAPGEPEPGVFVKTKKD